MNNVINAPRVVIAATSSGSGKTTITSALLYKLKNMVDGIKSYKCGPDYIDPMYHKSVLGIDSKNLDPFFCGDDLLKATFADEVGNFNVIEGCMGLYDGLGVSAKASTYEVACMLDSPIILVVDAQGMGYSTLAQIIGYLALDEKKLIRGIILNKISEAYYQKLSPVIEEKTGVKVVGFLPKLDKLVLSSRHLGLCSVEENDGLIKIAEIADFMGNTIDFGSVIRIAQTAKDLHIKKSLSELITVDLSQSVIGVAFDNAFNFYYRDNLRCLEMAGATLKYFSPISDKELPKGCTAVLLGGGYPENYLQYLSANKSMKESILNAVESGVPVIAECGGFMYLNSFIDNHEMVGVFNGQAVNKHKLVRFGYVSARFKDMTILGHEFHHFDVANPGDEFEMTKISTGKTYGAGLRYKNCIAGFPHFYYFSNPDFIKVFDKKYLEK